MKMQTKSSRLILLMALLAVSSCGGGGDGSRVQPSPPAAPVTPVLTVDVATKQLIFSWAGIPGATHYRLLENPDGGSGFTQVGANIPAATLSVRYDIASHLFDFTNALFMLEACNAIGCSASTELNTMNSMSNAIGYFKASNSERGIAHWDTEFWPGDGFGSEVAISADGNTLAVGAPEEDGGDTGINGDQSDNSALDAGAVYLFRLIDGEWSQQAYVKASNSGGGNQVDIYDDGDWFGSAIALSADGNVLAVGAPYEDSGATGINGDQDDNSVPYSGAVYVFRFDGTDWSQEAYVKASSPVSGQFGLSIALNADGTTLAVGANVFRFDGTDWSPQACVEFLESGVCSGSSSVGLSADGNLLATRGKIFRFDGAQWLEQACLGPDVNGDCVAGNIAISADGNTLVVAQSRAAKIYQFDGTDWFEQANIKTVNDEDFYTHGFSIALSGDGNMLASGESTSTEDASYDIYGTTRVFRFSDGVWSLQADSLLMNPGENGECWGPPFETESFGGSISLSADGSTMAVGASGEDSNATGVNGDRNNDAACGSGAAWLY